MAEARVRGGSSPLAGTRVLVTRPRHQSAGLASLVASRGGVPIEFPVIEILPARDLGPARDALASLDDRATVIFVSPNAVRHGVALMGHADSPARVVAVGETTAAALEAAGFAPVLRPAGGASSEALLALPELAPASVAGTRVVIVRGEGGRALLGETLSARGARVAYAEVYRRAPAAADAERIAELGAGGGIDVVVVTSVEGLENLFAALGGPAAGWLREVGYVVASQRIARFGQSLGVSEAPVVADGATDEALLDALIRWRGAHRASGS